MPKGEANGRWRPAIDRFASRCAFDPVTGCVMWIGGTTAGHGHMVRYGRFWYEGFNWFAHRWSARHIHGLEIDGLQVDHCCPHGPASLCVEHVAGETAVRNRELQHARPARVDQGLATRQHWIHVQVGIVEYEPRSRLDDGIPFFSPPTWLRPFLLRSEILHDCPF